MNWKSNKSLSINICLLIFISISINTTQSDSSSENERHKRTIGFLFRELVNAFQSPQQPAPMVTSFQPQRPTKQKKRPTKPTKSDAPLPNNPRPEKTILQVPVTTESADVQLTSPVEPPIAAAPLQNPLHPDNSILIPPQNNLPSTHAENHQQNQPNPLFVPANPFEKMIPPPGHHPLMPLKAQIFFLPFQNSHELTYPSPKTADPHFNYEAEIYFHTPQNTIYPPTNNYPARYSPSNGWRDVDEIISRTTQKAKQYPNTNVENLTHPDYRQLNFQNLEGLSPKTDSTLGTSATNVPAQNSQESSLTTHRRLDMYQDQEQLIERPSYAPYQEFGNSGNDFYKDNGNHHENEDVQYDQYILQSAQTGTPNFQQELQDGSTYTSTRTLSRAHDYIPQRSKSFEGQSYGSEYQQEGGYRRNDNIVQYLHTFDDQIGYEHYPTKIGRLPHI